jgi:hypothetical protein
MEFDGPVESLEAIWETLRRLVGQIVPQLARLGAGARRLEAEFRRAYAPPVHKTVLLAHPNRDAKSLFHLLRCATEQLDGGDDGFTGVTLAVPLHERVTDEQLALDGELAGQTPGKDAALCEADVARLMEVLSVRLGPQAVLKSEAHACHLPERAYRTKDGVRAELAEVTLTDIRTAKKKRIGKGGSTNGSRRGHGLEAHVTGGVPVTRASSPCQRAETMRTFHPPPPKPTFPPLRLTTDEPPWEPLIPDLPADADPERTDVPHVIPPTGTEEAPPLSARPLRLLPVPRPLRVSAATLSDHGEEQHLLTLADGEEVMCVAHTAGPERIGGLWWEGHNKTRDYYDIETTEGKRLWVFRVAQTRKWYVHGVFF